MIVYYRSVSVFFALIFFHSFRDGIQFAEWSFLVLAVVHMGIADVLEATREQKPND